jgi:hypothetical protein
MTTTKAPAGTGLAQVAPGLLAQVRGQEPWTVAGLLDKLAGPAEELPAATPFPDPAPEVKFTDALREALDGIPSQFGKVNAGTRRMLTREELTAVTQEINSIDRLTKALGDRRKIICEMARTHQDVQAENEGRAVPADVLRKGVLLREATQRVASGVAKGHYLIAGPEKPYETPVQGFVDAWQQRYVKGSTDVSQAKLVELLDKGEITQAEYNACTRAVRILDEDKISLLIKRNPERGLQILKAITTRSAPSASLYPPKK